MSDEPEGDLVRGLRELAGGDEGTTFVVRRGSVSVTVEYSPGSTSSLSLSVPYDAHAKGSVDAGAAAAYRASASRSLVAVRPLAIELVPESVAHVRAKSAGVNREHQTDDREFDSAVYVDSPTMDPSVLHAVLCDDARRAILDLFATGMRKVTIDDARGRVVATLSEFATGKEVPARAEKMIAAFVKLAQALPPVKASGEAHARPPLAVALRIASAVTFLLFFAMVPLVQLMANAVDCTVESDDGDGISLKQGCGDAPLLGLMAGVVVGLVAVVLANRFLAPKMKGRSDSAPRMGLLYGVSFGLAGEVTFAVVTAMVYFLR